MSTSRSSTGRAPAPPTGAGPRPVTPVGIAGHLLARVEARLDHLAVDDVELRDDVRRARELTAGLEPYTARCTSPASTDLERLAADTDGHDWDAPRPDGSSSTLEREMLSGHVEGQALRLLLRVARARTALDVGLFTGYSALAMAEGLPDDGEVVACEVDGEVAAFARRALDRSPHGAKVTIEVGPAATTLDRLADAGRTFDVAFLDADKAGYAGYLGQLLDHGLVGPGGMVLADNTLLQGEPWASDPPDGPGAAIAAFNEAVVADDRVEQVLLPLRDGLTLMRVVDDAG